MAGVSTVTSGPKEIIDDIIQLSFNLLYGGSLNAVARTFEAIICGDDYAQELAKYEKDRRAWDLLGECALAYLSEIKNREPFADVIGAQYDAYLGKGLGQFLTPEGVAAGGVTLSILESVGRALEEGRHTDVGDIAAGAGALLLGSLREIVKTFGEDSLRYVHLIGNDVDPAMCRMCAVQLILPAILHARPFGSLTVCHSNVVTEYEQAGGDRRVILAVANAQDYAAYTSKFR